MPTSEQSFNLPAPPNFRGFDPAAPMTMYQRHLPHWRQEGATYFVTFRLADSLPRRQREYLKRLTVDWHRTHPPPQPEEQWRAFTRRTLARVEKWLDAGSGACWFREAPHLDVMAQTLLNEDSDRCFVGCWTVMPNHCHVVMRPAVGEKLERILQRWKSAVAQRVNEGERRVGQVWQQESFDRIVRDEEHLWRVMQYIGSNPSRAGLSPTGRRWIHPSWQAAGWKFIDQAPSVG